jgi:hypothetical protein
MCAGSLIRSILAAGGLLLALLHPQSTAARDVYSGSDLLINCGTAGVCNTYFAALLDSYSTLARWAGVAPAFCLTGSADASTLWPALRTGIALRPDRAERTAGSLVLLELQRKYPCADENATAIADQSSFLSGFEMLLLCQDLGICGAFLIGVLDSHTSLVDWDMLASPLVCIPEESTNPQIIASVLTYLSDHLDDLEYSAGNLFLLALLANYPCRSS